MAHAYLFHGPDGTGKRAAALALAATLQCERGRSEPCGACGACGRTSKLIHPDVQVLIPQPSDARPEDVRDRLTRMAEQPYASVDFVRRSSLDEPGGSNRQVQYSVARIHEELHRVMSLKPVEGRFKVAIVTDAEHLRREAANAFLKLLEEPTPKTVFVLTSTRPDRLLPTIVSRCQQIRFERLTEGEIADALTRRERVDPGLAAVVARMAEGSYSRALDLAGSEELLATRREVVDFLRSAYQAWSHGDQTAGHVERLSRQGREPLKFLLGLVMGWLRDVMLYRAMGEEAPVVNVDQLDEIRKFSAGVPSARIDALVELIEQAIDLIERNVQARLVLSVLAQRSSEVMRGSEERRLFVELTDAAP